MHAAQSDASQVTPSGSCSVETMSASASRPPGRSAFRDGGEHRGLVRREVDHSV